MGDVLVEATHQVVLRGDLSLQRAPSGGRSEVEGQSGAPDLQVAEGAATPLGEAVVDWWLSLVVVMVGVGFVMVSSRSVAGGPGGVPLRKLSRGPR